MDQYEQALFLKGITIKGPGLEFEPQQDTFCLFRDNLGPQATFWLCLVSSYLRHRGQATAKPLPMINFQTFIIPNISSHDVQLEGESLNYSTVVL